MRGVLILAAAAAAALAACGGGDAKKQLAVAEPASGAKLAEYSKNISNTASIGGNADFVQRLCKNALSTRCPENIEEILGQNGFVAGGTAVDLAYAFAVYMADKKDGEVDLTSTDEDYLWAAYHVAVARDPDTEGAMDNLNFIKDGGNRKTLLKNMLGSDEFKNQK